jgi:hypothetical protein
MGIAFAPLALDVIVKDASVTGLYFSPVRVTVAGRVRCLGTDCGVVTVGLRPESSGTNDNDDGTTVVRQEVATDKKNGGGMFIFENQLPGRYTLMVVNSGLCWRQPSISFTIESEAVDSLELVQTGWVMEVHSSHETQLRYRSASGLVLRKSLRLKMI